MGVAKKVGTSGAAKQKTSLQTRIALPKEGKRPTRGGALVVNLSDLNTRPAEEKIRFIKAGLSKTDLEYLKQAADLDYDTLSEILSVSRAKLLAKKGGEKFDALTSERMLLLADVLAYGKSVFEETERLTLWLKTPSRALGGQTPLELMDTVYGMEEVKKELGRIAYGVY